MYNGEIGKPNTDGTDRQKRGLHVIPWSRVARLVAMPWAATASNGCRPRFSHNGKEILHQTGDVAAEQGLGEQSIQISSKDRQIGAEEGAHHTNSEYLEERATRQTVRETKYTFGSKVGAGVK